MSRFVMPFASVFDALGAPMPGARLFFYASGTTTAQATYSNAARTIANPSPVVADAAGRFPNIWLADSLYKVELQSAAGVVIWTADPVAGFSPASELLSEGTMTAQQFTADGVAASYQLNRDVSGASNLIVVLGGIVQAPDSYSIAGRALTFSEVPPAGAIVDIRAIARTVPAVISDTYTPSGTGALPRTLAGRLAERVSVKDFGAAGDGVADDSAPIALALTYAMSAGKVLFFPAGVYRVVGAQFVASAAVIIEGEGRNSTRIEFSGAPVKAVRTYATWRAEYDAGNYAASSDAAIACAFRVTSQNVVFRSIGIRAYWDASADYPLPFSSATNFPSSGYDVGVCVQVPGVSFENCAVDGVWTKAALLGDCSQPGGGIDGLRAYKSIFSGMWGVRIEGASGAPISGDDFSDLGASDTRGAVGASDLLFEGCDIYDTSGSVRLRINGVANLLVRRSDTGGALYVSGQNGNSAKRIQGIRLVGTRLASSDRWVYFVNFANRVEFYACHSEYRAGAKGTDGVTALSAAQCETKSTMNARRLAFVGGERSGETDTRALKDTRVSPVVGIVSEVGYDDPDPPGSIPAGRMLAVDALRDRGAWTPTLYGSTTGTGVLAVGSMFGSYAKIGNIVHVQARIALTSKNAITGNISVGGLPFKASNLFGANMDVPITVLAGTITGGTEGHGGLINDNTNAVVLYKIRSAATLQNVADTDLADTSLLFLSGTYQTEEG